MAGLGFFADDVVDRANLPETPAAVPRYEDEAGPEPVATTDDMYVPEPVKKFIPDLHRAFLSRDVAGILALYEGAFTDLSEKYYKSSPWPKVEVIAPLVDKDTLFLVLYKEMYYRHVYSINNGQLVSLEDRVESFQNYFNLFAYLIKHAEKVTLAIPNQWIWDIIDEFIWQWNDYAKYRAKLARMHQQAVHDDEVDRNVVFVSSQRDIWSSVYVITTLNALVTKSGIVAHLESEPKDSENVALPFMKMIGYYAMIGLLRVHTLLGDYHTAIRSVDAIDFTRRIQLFSRVVACHIALFYYTGFVYLMMRRYADAIKFFTQLLAYINRIKTLHARAYQYDDIAKKNEQVHHLLAMALSLCPQRGTIDEVLLATLKDRLGEKMIRLEQGDVEAYSEMFKYACPKFVTFATNFKDEKITVTEALDIQRRVFLNDVSQQLVLPTIHSYLSLYSTITVSKLASFMERDHPVTEREFRTYLLMLKHKTCQPTWTGGKPSEGERACVSDISFYIDKEMVYIQNHATGGVQTRSHTQYFVDQIRYLKPCLDTLYEGRQ